MKIFGKEKIIKFNKKHPEASRHLNSWVKKVELSTWNNPHDIKKNFNNSYDQLGDSKGVFNVKHNNYRVVVQVRYCNGMVLIDGVYTHSEYDKLRLK
jgi:mRNA interferase HigB